MNGNVRNSQVHCKLKVLRQAKRKQTFQKIKISLPKERKKLCWRIKR